MADLNLNCNWPLSGAHFDDAAHDQNLCHCGHTGKVVYADPAQSAPSAEELANAEHDSVFPPWNERDESAHAFIIRALAEHSDSHMTWVTHYEKNPEKQGKVSEGHSLEYQKRCIFRYNQIFRAFKELNEAAAIRTAQLREKTIQECVAKAQAIYMAATWGSEARDTALGIMDSLRALLTVAAQTPEEK